MFNQGFAHGIENITFMEYGDGPAASFGAALPAIREKADEEWVKCVGSDNSKWPFNTGCCTYNNQPVDSCYEKPSRSGIMV